jgi:hypothetical protein
MGFDLRLTTAASNGPIVHPPGNARAWIAKAMAVSTGKLLTRPPELSGNSASRDIWDRVGGMGEGVSFACQYLRYVNGPLTCRKILQHGASGFASHPKEGVLRIFIALTNQSHRLV